MKFLLLKWRAEFQNYHELDLSPFGEIVFDAKEIAAKYDLELESIIFLADTLQAYFYGSKSNLKKFICEFRRVFIERLKSVYKKDLSNTMSDVYIIREIKEDNLCFTKSIKTKISVRNINKELFANAYQGLSKPC